MPACNQVHECINGIAECGSMINWTRSVLVFPLSMGLPNVTLIFFVYKVISVDRETDKDIIINENALICWSWFCSILSPTILMYKSL